MYANYKLFTQKCIAKKLYAMFCINFTQKKERLSIEQSPPRTFTLNIIKINKIIKQKSVI